MSRTKSVESIKKESKILFESPNLTKDNKVDILLDLITSLTTEKDDNEKMKKLENELTLYKNNGGTALKNYVNAELKKQKER
jgi:hypothetical protein